MPGQPGIEHVVHEQVAQQWADYPSLRGTLTARHHAAIRLLLWRGEPSFHVEQCPLIPDVFVDCLEQQSVRYVVEQTADVKLDHPVIAPTPLPSDSDRIQRRFARPVAVGVVQKVRLDVRLDLQLDDHLCHSVRHRRHPEDPLPARFLRYRDRFYRCGKVAP